MNQNLDVQELSLVIAVERQDPSLLTPDFLRYSGIIPQDWELARQPVRGQQVAQVSYQNGVSVLAYADRTVFVERLVDKTEDSVELPQIAQRYSEVLQNLNFQAVGTNFRGHVLFPSAENGAHHYLCHTLLSPGSWQNIGTAPMRAGVNLVYTLERNVLNLSVQEAMLQLPEQERVPIVLFTANFETPLRGKPASEQTTMLRHTLNHWQDDLTIYKQTIDRLLQSQSENLLLKSAIAT